MKQTRNYANNLSELKLNAMGFDTAKSVPIYVTSRKLRDKSFQGVWNIDKDKLSCIASKHYKIIQHRDLVTQVADALQRLNFNTKAKIRDSGNRIIVDLTFVDSKLNVKKGEEFYTGLRIINSYDKTTGVMILPHLVRLACDNGMVYNVGYVKSVNIRHNQKISETFYQITKKIINNMVESNDKFKELVEKSLIDSVEWEILDKIMEKLFQTEKHREQIQEILYRKNLHKISRWDLYNAVTNYVTHNEALSVGIDIALQTKAQKILVKSFNDLTHKEEVN